MANVYHLDVDLQSSSPATAGPETTQIAADTGCAQPSTNKISGQNELSDSSAPILKLLPELFRYIFVCVHELYLKDLEDLEDLDDLLRTVWAAGDVHLHMLVCRAWKSHILDIPKLWSTIHIDAGEFSYEPEPVMMRLRSWKDRSRNAPLHVRLTSNTTQELVPMWIDIIQPDIVRWATIRLYADFETRLSPEDIGAIWNDLNLATHLTSLDIQGIELQPVGSDILPTPCIQSLSTLRVAGVRPPLIKMPALRSLELEGCVVASGEDVWKLLTASPHLEKIHISVLKVMGPGASDADSSWTPDPSILALQDLHLVGLEDSPFEGQSEFLKVLLLAGNKGNLKALALRGMPSALDIHLHPSGPAFPYLNTLILSFMSKEATALHMIGLLAWLKQARLLRQLTFNPGQQNPGFAELLLQMLSIPHLQSRSDTSKVVCPALNLLVLGDSHAPASISLPSLLLRVLTQRREFLGEVKSHPDDDLLIPYYPRFFSLGLHIDVLKPLLGDAKVKDPEDTGLIHGRIEELSQLREILDDTLTEIGGGLFDVDSLLWESDPQKRMRDLCSLLDICSVPTLVNSIVE